MPRNVSKKERMARIHWVSTIAGVGIVAALALAWRVQQPTATAGAKPASAALVPQGAPMVDVAPVEVSRLSDDVQAVGSLRSRQGVMLRPEVSGRVAQINFRDGGRVRKGQLLVQLDDQLPQAQVLQARAETSIAVANHQRNKDLVGQGFISQRTVEESAAALEVAQAKLALARATAERLRIVAPFDGIAGIRGINVGDYLKDGADMVNVEDIDALYVDFRLPERYQNKVRPGQTAHLTFDALPGARYDALIQAVDPLIDANGRSVGLRGCVDNRRLELRPGMFARVTTVLGERERALLVPEEALVPQGERVSVIRLIAGAQAGERQTQRVGVRVGTRLPGKVEILNGLQAGDVVVTAGQQRIQKDGTTVRVMDAAARAEPTAARASATSAGPAASAAPRPSAPVVRAVGATVGANPCLLGRL